MFPPDFIVSATKLKCPTLVISFDEETKTFGHIGNVKFAESFVEDFLNSRLPAALKENRNTDDVPGSTDPDNRGEKTNMDVLSDQVTKDGATQVPLPDGPED